MQALRICINCIHCQIGQDDLHLCLNDNNKTIDLVTGEEMLMFCRLAREVRYPNRCGPEGYHYEEIDHEPDK